MRRFQFRMEKYLRLQEHLESIQRVRMLDQRKKVDRSARAVEAASANQQIVAEGIVKRAGSRWKASELHDDYRFLLRLEKIRLEMSAQLEKETHSLEEERGKWIERKRARRTLERLKEKRFEVWRSEANAEEQKGLDEVGNQIRFRSSQRGGIYLTTLLVIAVLGSGFLCFYAWKNYLRDRDTQLDLLEAPFDYLAEYVEELPKVKTWQHQQRVLRQKRESELLEREREEPPEVSVEREGIVRTLERIRQKEDMLRRKEEELTSREKSAELAQRELQAELNRMNNLQQRVSTELAQLQELEERRTREILEERAALIEELSRTVKEMKPSDAAALLLEIAFPDPTNPFAPPFPAGESFEGPDLVLAVLREMPAANRAEVFNKMVRTSAPKTAVLSDMFDNPRTGLEPDFQ